MMAAPFIPVRWLIDTPNLTDPAFLPLLPGQSFLMAKEPEWSTSIQEAKSGREFRIAEWSYPIWHFRVSYEVIRESLPTLSELTQLFEFFNLRMGQFGTFYYLDPSEPEVTDQFIGYGDGANVNFQLTRNMGTWTEPVQATYGPVTIKVDGATVTSGYSVSSYGLIVFDAPVALGASVTWSGRSAYFCRFKQDRISPAEMVRNIWSLDGLEFRSIKP